MTNLVTYQSSQTNTALTGSVVVTKPVSLAVGDLLITGLVAEGTSVTAFTAPAGWTSAITPIASSSRLYGIYYKVATSTETAATDFTFSANGTVDRMGGSVTRLTTFNTSLPFDQISGAAIASTTAFSTTGITPTLAAEMHLIFTMGTKSTSNYTVASYAVATQSPTFTEAFDVFANQIGMSMAYGTRSPALASGNATATASATVDFGAIFILSVPSVPMSPLTFSSTMLRPDLPISVMSPFHLSATLNAPTISSFPSMWDFTDKPAAPAWDFTDKP